MENTDPTVNIDSTDGARHSTLLELYSVINKGKRIILLCLALVTGLAALYTFLTNPTYEATALILIDVKAKQGSLPFLDITGIDAATKINNELETLRSSSLANAVADALLQMQFFDSARTTPIPIVARVEAERVAPQIKTQLVGERLARMVDFTPQKESDVIKVSARSPDPLEAALLANTYTTLYAQRNLEVNRQRSRAAKEFLAEQMQGKHQNLDTSERALQDYMSRSKMVSLDIGPKKVVEQLAQVEANRDAIEVEISSYTRTIKSYKEELARLEPNVAKSMGESGDVYIKLLQDQMAKLEVQRDIVLSQNPTANSESEYSQQIKDVDSQIAALKKNLQSRTQDFMMSVLPSGTHANADDRSTAYLGELKQKIIEQQIAINGLNARKAALNKVVAEYERQFNQIPRKSIELAKLQRSRLSSEKLYLMVEEKYNEASISESSLVGSVVVIDPAAVPLRPVRPVVWINMMIGFTLGLGLGVCVVVLRAAIDIRISSVEDLKRRGYEVLSTVGNMTGDKSLNRKGGSVKVNGEEFDTHLVSYHNPLSPYAESYRHLRVAIQHLRPDLRIRTLVVTSANPGEGKTTTIANLAIAFAEADKKTLLVDADMRRPSIHERFGLKQDPGLADYLFKRIALEDISHHRVMENLDVICSGGTPANPAAVIGSAKMERFLEEMSHRYDVVLLDTAPLHAVSDASVLAAMTDATVLVVGAGTTKLPAVESAYENLKSLGAHVFGVVLNKFDVRKALREAYGSDGYGYYRYGYDSSNRPGNGQEKQAVTTE